MHPLSECLIEMGFVLVVLVNNSQGEIGVIIEKVVISYEHGVFSLVEDDLCLAPVLVDTVMLVALDEIGELLADVSCEHQFCLLALKLHNSF